MKKIVLFSLISIFGLALNAQFTKIGAGVDFGTGLHFNQESGADHRSGLLSLFVAGIYEFSLPVHIAPSFSYTFPNVTKYEVPSFVDKSKVSSMHFNLDGHYVFNFLDKMEFYGLGGLNVVFLKRTLEFSSVDEPKISTSDNGFGLNIGAGTYFKVIEQGDFFAEVKYTVGKYDQLLVRAGLLLNIDWLKKNEANGL